MLSFLVEGLVVGEEEAAWPERSEGLVRPVLCVSCMLHREAGFVSFYALSVLGPSLAKSHTLHLLAFGRFTEYLQREKRARRIFYLIFGQRQS